MEDLFPDQSHGRSIYDLVFTLADWHACAKLRLHTTSTVTLLQDLTRTFGIRLRHFAKHICPAYDTRELAKEEAARVRRQAKMRSQGNTSKQAHNTNSGPKNVKTFHMATYKLHAMGDYVDQITHFGSTDSYSTQPVSVHALRSYCDYIYLSSLQG